MGVPGDKRLIINGTDGWVRRLEKLGDSAGWKYPTCAEQHIRSPQHNYSYFPHRSLRVIIYPIRPGPEPIYAKDNAPMYQAMDIKRSYTL